MRPDLEELYKENCRTLTAVAMRYVHDKDVAEDIVHDSWIIIFTNLDRLKSEDKLLPWMKGIVKNLSLKYLDNKKRHPSTAISENQENISAEESEASLPLVPFDELMSMIDSLPEKYGEVFRLSVLSGMTHQEIGALLGIAPHSSSSNLSRARSLLLKKVQKYLLMTLAILLPLSILFFHKKENKPDDAGTYIAQEETEINQEPGIGTPLMPEETPAPARGAMSAAATETAVPSGMDKSAATGSADAKDKESLQLIGNPASIRPAIASTNNTSSSIRSFPDHSAAQAMAQAEQRKAGLHPGGGWTGLFGLSGVAGLSSATLANAISLADYSGTPSSAGSLRFHNWDDYTNYVLSNNAYLNENDRRSIMKMLSQNMGEGLEPVETQHHYRPLTIRLSAEKVLNERWALESGLGLTYLKSEFENDYLGHLGDREQKLYYLGIPLGIKYTALSRNRLSLYISCGGELDIPVYGRQTVVGAAPTRVSGSFMGALETSAGIQYGITRNLNAYVEAGIRYNITGYPTFDTYYSSHPIMFSTPFGLRWQF